MVKRIRIALIYAYNENWIGGTYYIENLIAALAQLPDAAQPELLVLSREATDAAKLRAAVHYPYWSFRQFERPLSLLERAINKVVRTLTKRQLIRSAPYRADLIFPMPTGMNQLFSRIPHHLYWIPDFQEHYLPDFFQPEEIIARKNDQQLILQTAKHIVFSSRAAQQDFNSLYPGAKPIQHVLSFAVTNKFSNAPETCQINYEVANKKYFICSNQFWKHKNHSLVLEAVAQVRLIHPDVLVLFTGKEHDYRNPEYFEELMLLREELNVVANTKFLGFIPRQDQIELMAGALAVIQASLFEGWSTVVEDAKSMQLSLLVSDLSVHKEQATNYDAAEFFDPDNASELVYLMDKVWQGKPSPNGYEYHRDITKFSYAFMDICRNITSE